MGYGWQGKIVLCEKSGETMIKEKPVNTKIPKGTILVYSIGSGCDELWQVIDSTPKFVKARAIKEKIVNRSIKRQTFDILPIKDAFLPPEMESKYIGGYKEGKPRFKEVDKNLILLKVVPDANRKSGLRIGPIKRLIWWTIWQNKALNQYSP